MQLEAIIEATERVDYDLSVVIGLPVLVVGQDLAQELQAILDVIEQNQEDIQEHVDVLWLDVLVFE